MRRNVFIRETHNEVGTNREVLKDHGLAFLDDAAGALGDCDDRVLHNLRKIEQAIPLEWASRWRGGSGWGCRMFPTSQS